MEKVYIGKEGYTLKMTRKYKIRKSGNSDITTIPPEVKKYIGVETGESIIYIYQTDGTVKIAKAEEELDIDSIVDSVMDQYNQALKDLVDL
ncbi:hypothetical protein IGI47_001554 [Enterococcus sp. AZ191]